MIEVLTLLITSSVSFPCSSSEEANAGVKGDRNEEESMQLADRVKKWRLHRGDGCFSRGGCGSGVAAAVLDFGLIEGRVWGFRGSVIGVLMKPWPMPNVAMERSLFLVEQNWVL